jgi:hypothetical protein
VLACEEAAPLESEHGQRAERTEQSELLFPEERRVRIRPNDERAGGNGKANHALLVLDPRGRCPVHAVRSDDLILVVEENDCARSHQACHPRECALDDIVWRGREAHELVDPLAQDSLLGLTPDLAQVERRRESDEEEKSTCERE